MFYDAVTNLMHPFHALNHTNNFKNFTTVKKLVLTVFIVGKQLYCYDELFSRHKEDVCDRGECLFLDQSTRLDALTMFIWLHVVVVAVAVVVAVVAMIEN